jgi:hypothetical protein
MKRVSALLAAIAVVCALWPNVARAADDKVELKFRFKKGDTYRLKVKIEQDIVQTFQSEQQETKQTIGIGETLNVKDVDAEGTMTVEVVFGPMSMKSKGPMGELEYDSENPPDEIALQARAFAAMVGQGFTMKLTPEGHVTAIEGVDEMFQKIFDAVELPKGPMKEAMIKDLKRQFGNDALSETMEKMMAMFPDKPVAVGDSWTRTMTVATGLPSIIEDTWTLVDRKDGVATIEVESTLKPNENAAPMKMGPFSMKFNLTGTQTGTLKLDEATGWFVGATITQDMSGTMVMTGGIPSTDQETTVPMTIETATTIESQKPATAPE